MQGKGWGLYEKQHDKTLIIVFLFSVCLSSAWKAIAQTSPLVTEEYFKLEIAHSEEGRYGEALEAYKQANKLKSEDADLLFFLHGE